MNKSNKVFDMTAQNVYMIVCATAERAGVGAIRPHDLRRTCAKQMRAGGAKIEQISVTLGHADIKTTERYLGTALELDPGQAATDHIKL